MRSWSSTVCFSTFYWSRTSAQGKLASLRTLMACGIAAYWAHWVNGWLASSYSSSPTVASNPSLNRRWLRAKLATFCITSWRSYLGQSASNSVLPIRIWDSRTHSWKWATLKLRPQRSQLPLQHGIMLLHSMNNQLKILSISIDEDDLLLQLFDLVLRLSKCPLCIHSHIVPSPLHRPDLIQLRYKFFIHVLVL